MTAWFMTAFIASTSCLLGEVFPCLFQQRGWWETARQKSPTLLAIKELREWEYNAPLSADQMITRTGYIASKTDLKDFIDRPSRSIILKYPNTPLWIGRDEKGGLLSTEKKAAVDVDPVRTEVFYWSTSTAELLTWSTSWSTVDAHRRPSTPSTLSMSIFPPFSSRPLDRPKCILGHHLLKLVCHLLLN